MSPRRPDFALACRLLVALVGLCTNGYAKPQELQGSDPPTTSRAKASVKDLEKDPKLNHTDDAYESVIENRNSLECRLEESGVRPKGHLDKPDAPSLGGRYLAVSAGGGNRRLLRHRPGSSPALSGDPKKLNRYSNFSNYGVYSLVGAGGGLYVWSKLSHDDHQRETGILAGEAAINSFAVDTTFKYAFGRERPNQGQGLGNFFQHGVSFPSDHSA